MSAITPSTSFTCLATPHRRPRSTCRTKGSCSPATTSSISAGRGCRNAIPGNGSALKSIEALDVETIVPGHGDPCTKAYLKEQGQIVENWVGYVERFVDRGITADEALKEP